MNIKDQNYVMRAIAMLPDELWAGTERSLQAAIFGMSGIQAYIHEQPPAEPVEVPYNYTLQGNIGIISIQGSLVNSDSPWLRYMGMMSYDEVRNALIHAANDTSAQAIILNIESGGGAVAGVADTADLIASIHKGVKPVYAYTDGAMASAAYWLGVSAGGGVYNSRTAMVGSVGVITTHVEMSKMYQEAGITATVLREGEYKALANRFEPLTDKAKDQIQAQLKATNDVFADHAAAARGVSRTEFDSKMGRGREFIGIDAVNAGLTDGVMSFDALVSKVSKKLVDKNAAKEQTALSFQRGNPMNKQALTETQIAALAAGAPQVAAANVEVVPPTEAPAAAPQAAAAPAAPAAAAPAAAPAVAPAADAATTVLQSLLREANASLTTVSVENASLKAKLSTVEATHTGLIKIAATSLSNMKVALGFSAIDASSMTAEQILVEHDKTLATFQEKFKAGGVAAVTETAADPAKEGMDADTRRILAANRYPQRNK